MTKLLLGVSALALASTLSATATAQVSTPPTSAGVSELEELVITARRREERLQDVPIAVTAFSGDRLVERGVLEVMDLQRVAPGVLAQPTYGKRSTPALTIRGFRTSQAIPSQDTAVALYFADAVMTPTNGLGSAFYDLASVQVLKGPQGTLFGRNSPGGSVLITPEQPGASRDGYLRIGYGNYDSITLEGASNFSLTDDFQARAAFTANERDGFYSVGRGPMQGRDMGDNKNYNGRLSFLWSPTDSLSNYTVLYYDHDRNNGTPAELWALNPNTAAASYKGTGAYAKYPDITPLIRTEREFTKDAYTEYPTYDKNDSYGFVNTTTVPVGDFTLKNIAAWRQVRNRSASDFDGADALILLSQNFIRSKTFSEELQLQGLSFDSRVNWVAGLFYYDQRASDESIVAALDPISPNNTQAYLSEVINRSYAAYAQFTVQLPVEGLSFTAGGRYTVDERKLSVHNQWTTTTFPQISNQRPNSCTLLDANNAPLPLAACERNLSDTFQSPTWTLTLDYKATPDTLIYLTSRRGYRSGGFNARGNTLQQLQPFDPEVVYDVELGLKSDFRVGDWWFRANAAAYYNWYNDIQRNGTAVIDGRPTSTIYNAAKAKVPGVELELTMRPTPSLEVTASYAYVKPEFTEFPYLVNGVVYDFTDRRFAGISDNTASISAIYTLPTPAEYGTFRATASYYYRSDFTTSDTYQSKEQMRILYTPAQYALIPDVIPGLTQDGYGLVDARLDWEVPGSNLTASLWVKNAFDEYYGTPGAESQYTGVGHHAVIAGDPRTFGLDLRWRFE